MQNLHAFWMNLPAHVHPVAFTLGSLEIRWYSLMYMTAILVCYVTFVRQCRAKGLTRFVQVAPDLLSYAILGILLGARLGYALFYDGVYFLAHPLELFWPFHEGHFTGISGLSYHGGAIGFLLAMYLVTRQYKIPFRPFFNELVTVIPLGYTFGRLGNFLNQELYGRATSSWLGMRFPTDQQHLVRYPSQLFEAVGEGLLLYFFLQWLVRQPRWSSYVTPAYMIGYGLIRFIIEFTRQPDPFQALLFGIFSYGQLLCGIMVALGLFLIPWFGSASRKG